MREMDVFMSASLELRSGWLVGRRRQPYDLALKLRPHANRGGGITTASAPRSSFFMMISMAGNFAEEARNRVGDIDSSQTPAKRPARGSGPHPRAPSRGPGPQGESVGSRP
jgi:hypothetical protein